MNNTIDYQSNELRIYKNEGRVPERLCVKDNYNSLYNLLFY